MEKVDPLLLLFGSMPENKIRQICQKEMVRYGHGVKIQEKIQKFFDKIINPKSVLDSYSVNSNVRGRG